MTYCQMFGRCHTPSAHPSLLMFCTDCPIAWISSLLCCTGSLAVVLSLWQRAHNRMDSYRVNTVDVPESPIASSARDLLQQQRCNSLHCHEEWWGSVPPSVIIFSWALDEGGAAGMCSSKQHLPSVLEVQHGAILHYHCHMPQWISPSQHIV